MKFIFLRTVFVFTFSALTIFSYAQNVFIATDFVACATGLKDSSGKWIVQPIYQNIQKWPEGTFKVLYGSKEGVIDSNGTIIIPAIYDHVRFSEYSDSSLHLLITVMDGGKTGLLNTKNQFIVPMVCRQIDVDPDGLIIAEKTWKRYSIYTLDGRETSIPKKQGTEPLLMGDHLFAVSRNSFGFSFVRRYFPKSKPRHRYRWRVTLRKKYGVMNDSLRVIVPKKFSSVYYGPMKYKLITVQKRKKSGYYSIKGKEIWKPVSKIGYGRTYRFGSSVSIMNAEGVTAALYNKKYGIISAEGDTILPFIYTSIYMPYYNSDASNWTVEINGKAGIYNPSERKWVLEPLYGSLFPIENFKLANDTLDESTQFIHYRESNSRGLKLLIARKDGKFGLITSSGQEILPFIHDDYANGLEGYIFKKDSSFILVSLPKYTAVVPGETYSIKKNIVSKAPEDLKFKMITTESGVTLFINPDLIKDSLQLALYDLKTKNHVINNENYDHLLHSTAVVITPIHQSRILPGIGKVYSYHSTDMNYTKGDSSQNFIIQTKPYFYLHTFSIEFSDDFHTYYSVGRVSGVYREDGFCVLRPGSYNYFNPVGKVNGLEYFAVDCGKNKIGLIDGNGKLLLDTIWGGLGDSNGKYMWVIKKHHKRGNDYRWNILDTTTNQLLLSKKFRSISQSDLGKAAVIIDRPEGKKLYNMDSRSYLLDGNIRGIFALDSAQNYFAVRTCYGNIGIIDANGKWLTDTIWKMIINAENDTKNQSRYRDYSFYYSQENEPNGSCYFVLSNDTGWTIFDGTNGSVSKNEKTKHFLMSTAFNSMHKDSIHGIIKFCADCPSFAYPDSTIKKMDLAPWQESLLFDSLFTASFIPDTLFHWSNYGCSDCRKRNPKHYFQYAWAGNYDRENLHHVIEYKNESCISVSRENLVGYREINPRDLFFTVMLFSDGPHNMLLDSLFAGEEWKSVISTETSLYFESHPNIKGSCHNPYMLPVVMKDRFVITPTGIVLYPPNYKENDHQLSVPIAWEKLKPYLRKDVAEKIGLK
ncbi:MAG: WG repeat-containing protein [Bacteroidia bacterium]